MQLFQKTPTISRTSALLSVDKDLFAELVGQTQDSYQFSFEFKLSLNNAKKDPKDYDRVVITVKKKEATAPSYSNILGENITSKLNVSSLTQQNSQISNLSSNLSLSKTVVSPLKPQNGLLTTKLPVKIANKQFAGLQLLNDLNKKEDYLERVEVFVSPHIESSYDSVYSITELVAPKTRPQRGIQTLSNALISSNTTNSSNQFVIGGRDTSGIDPNDLLERINAELCDITQPVTDSVLSKLTSESMLNSNSTKMKNIAYGRSSLSYDIVKYYLTDVKKSTNEESDVWYEKKRSTKKLNAVSIQQILSIKKANKNMNLSVRFDLYKRSSNTVDETVSVDLYIPSHVEAFDSITMPPVIAVSRLPMFQETANLRSGTFYSLSINDKEKNGKVKKFNVYMKTIDSRGVVSGYKQIGSVINKSNVKMTFASLSRLSAIRVVPVDMQNKEANVYTNTIVGPGYDAIGDMTILVSNKGKNEILVEVCNVPKTTTNLTLYKRDCTENPDDQFKIASAIRGRVDNTSSAFVDKNVVGGRIYEYYAVSLCSGVNNKSQQIPVISNFVLFKNGFNNESEKSVSVSLSEQSTSVSQTGVFTVSFKLETSITQSENERITLLLKEQLPELYAQYLDPNTSSSSPLGDNGAGIQQYKSLFFHEVIRTNLNTGEREVFDLVGDGVFEDNPTTRKVFNVKSISPQNEYRYQVFTYMKNPIEMFKKYVARGIDVKGREWFYRPYKWMNSAAKSGKLYPDDKDGIPIIESYEVYTSEPKGLTASYRVVGSAQYTELTQVIANRIDRNTVKINWDFQNKNGTINSTLYDSFVVLKVVNGIRSFVGRSSKNYIYHQLTEDDLGSIYYIIVPIMSEFDIDEPGFSNHLVISPDGLTSKVKISAEIKKPLKSFEVGKPDFNVNNTQALNSSITSIDAMKSSITDLLNKKGF